MKRQLACLAPVVLALAAPALAAAPTVPTDSQPWWAPTGGSLAFQRDSPTLESSDVLFTPAVRGDEADIIGPGIPRGFRPGPIASGGGQLLVELGDRTSVRDAADREVGSVPGTDAAWSPNGTHVAYLSGGSLWVADPAGGDAHAVATGVALSPTDATGPVWSPDGTELALSTPARLLAVAADGSGVRTLFDGDNANPSWSFDGLRIAFEHAVPGRLALWIVNRAGDGAQEAPGATANARFPQWSPTTDRLAFLGSAGGAFSLYVEGGGAPSRKLVGLVSPSSPPRWSPDGARLAVAAAPECRRFGIYVVAATGGKPVRRSNQCRLNGTEGGDVIQGSRYFDIIRGFDGNDSLFGGAGDDVLYGGAGNDLVGGGPGNDVVYGGSGDDTLYGSAGNDTIYAGSGHDHVGCGPGNDTAYVKPGDTVRACEHVHRS